MAVDSVTCAWSCPTPAVGAQRGGDRHVPGELGQQPGVDRLVVGHVAEPHPRVQHGRPDGCVGVAGVGAVDDPQVPAGHRHVVRLGLVRAGHVRGGIGVADHVGRGDVEQQRAGRAGPVALDGPDAEGGEGPAAGDGVELDA